MTKFNGWYFFPILLKIKIQVLNRHISEICTIDLQNSNFLSQNRRRSYPCNRGTLLTAASPPAHNFHHFNNRFFPLENPVYYIMIYVNKKKKKKPLLSKRFWQIHEFNHIRKLDNFTQHRNMLQLSEIYVKKITLLMCSIHAWNWTRNLVW